MNEESGSSDKHSRNERINIKVPDTMFSIRARATIGGRTVYGWICTQSVKVTVHDGEKVHEEERDLLHFFANKKETN